LGYWCQKYLTEVNKGKAFAECLIKGCNNLMRVNKFRLSQLKKENKKCIVH
jgi:hypothetical protein